MRPRFVADLSIDIGIFGIPRQWRLTMRTELAWPPMQSQRVH